MLDESSNLEADAPEPQPEEKGNRTFLLIAGIFAILIFLTLVCIALYFLVIRPRQAATQTAQEETAEAQRIEQSQAMTATAEAALFTPTFLPTAVPTKTQTRVAAASPTLVVIVATPLASPEATETLSVEAAQTQLAGQMTQTAAVAGAAAGAGATPLPTTGFFDEVGLPLLLVLTVALLVVIFVTRRLRKAPTR
jgi:cytoskeletal protein RodZ